MQSQTKKNLLLLKSLLEPYKNKMYKYMTSISKNVYIDKLDVIVNIYRNIYHSTIKMKPIDVNSSTYIDFNKGNNKEDRKFKVGGHIRMSKYKNIFAKDYVPNWSEEVFVLKKLKILFHGHMLLVILKVKKLLERFRKKNCKKQIKEFKVEKAIKREGYKLYAKWKGFDNSFNNWIDIKHIIN